MKAETENLYHMALGAKTGGSRVGKRGLAKLFQNQSEPKDFQLEGEFEESTGDTGMIYFLTLVLFGLVVFSVFKIKILYMILTTLIGGF